MALSSLSLQAVYWINDNNFLNPRNNLQKLDLLDADLLTNLVKAKIQLKPIDTVSKFRKGLAQFCKAVCTVGVTVTVAPIGIIVNGSRITWHIVRAFKNWVHLKFNSTHVQAVQNKNDAVAKIKHYACGLFNDIAFAVAGIAPVIMVACPILMPEYFFESLFFGGVGTVAFGKALHDPQGLVGFIPNKPVFEKVYLLYLGLCLKNTLGIANLNGKAFVPSMDELKLTPQKTSSNHDLLTAQGALFDLYQMQIKFVSYELYKLSKDHQLDFDPIKRAKEIERVALLKCVVWQLEQTDKTKLTNLYQSLEACRILEDLIFYSINAFSEIKYDELVYPKMIKPWTEWMKEGLKKNITSFEEFEKQNIGSPLHA